MLRSVAASLVAAFAVSSCALKPSILPSLDPQAEQRWHEHQQRLAPIDQWELAGKLGIKFPQDSSSANIRWQQQHTEFNIVLNGPFGRGAARLSGTPDWITVQVAGEQEQSSSDPASLLKGTLGWDLPINEMRHWAKGIPADLPIEEYQINDRGQLLQLQQAGWLITYTSYQAVDNLTLPKRLIATRDDVRITLVITLWRIPKATGADPTARLTSLPI